MTRAPLRFLIAILALWIGVRAAVLLPGGLGNIVRIPAAAAEPPRLAGTPPGPPSPGSASSRSTPPPPVRMAGPVARPDPPRRTPGAPILPLASGPNPAGRPAPPAGHAAAAIVAAASQPIGASAPPPGHGRASRWSASAWLLVRDQGEIPVLAPGGTLGGSQAGARLLYRLGHGFALSGRVYLPLRRTAGAEAAAGLDWRPLPALPVNLLAERRQKLGREGRSAFTLTVYGGASRDLAPRVRLDLYGQAGVVGLRSRDLFVDGSIRVARRIGPVELGGGAWGSAQPGAARLDAGPSLSWRLPVPNANLRLQADWRFRIAGDAAPGSGPALTLAADF